MSQQSDAQVYIYFEDPEGQVMQVSYREYRNYWRFIGWTLMDKASILPGFEEPGTGTGLQGGLL
jgi:hypothetical protein